MKHYAMATKQQLTKALAEPTGKMPEWVAQQSAQSPATNTCPAPAPAKVQPAGINLSLDEEETWRDVITLADLLRDALVGGTELESVTSTMSTLRSNQLS